MKAETRTQTHAPGTPAKIGGSVAGRAHKHTHLNTQARNGGAQPKPEPKHPQAHRTPEPGLAGYKRSALTNTHTPHPSQDRRGESQNPNPDTRTMKLSQDSRLRGGAPTKKHTPKTPHLGMEVRAETPTQAPTPTPHTPARIGGVQAERAHQHTHPNTPAGIGGVKAETRTQTHTHEPQLRLAA